MGQRQALSQPVDAPNGVFGQALLIQFSFADTLFVSPEGSDSNSGSTRELAMKSPEKAVQNADAGDTVFLLPGVFRLREQIRLKTGVNLLGSGSEGASRTVLTADWVESEYKSSLGWTDSKYLVRIEDAGEQTVAHFALDGNEWHIVGGLITEGSDNLRVLGAA